MASSAETPLRASFFQKLSIRELISCHTHSKPKLQQTQAKKPALKPEF